MSMEEQHHKAEPHSTTAAPASAFQAAPQVASQAASESAGEGTFGACDPENASGGLAGHRSRGRWIWRGVLALLVLLPVLGMLGGVFGVGTGALWTTILERHQDMKEWIAAHPVWAVGAFGMAYFVAVMLSLPGAVWMSLLGGYLFGPWVGTAVVVSAASGGAVAVFLLARAGVTHLSWPRRVPLLPSSWRERLGGPTPGAAFWVLLSLRLMPIFPFWMVNLLAAASGVRVGVYTLTTVVGILPGAAVYCGLGGGVGDVLAAGQSLGLDLMVRNAVVWPLLGLGGLALLPVGIPVLRRWCAVGKGR